MTIPSTHGILTEMCDIILDDLRDKGLEVTQGSYLANLLATVRSSKRRDWLKSYLSDSVYFLLHGILDQVYSLDAILAARNRATVSISGLVILRTSLEYGFKLAYLTTPDINDDERISRTIRLYYTDLYWHRRLPSHLMGDSAQHIEQLIQEWYKELNGGQALKRTISARSIFDSIGDPEDEAVPWPKNKEGDFVNPVYSVGYHMGSTIIHGNLWAIKHHGVTKIGKVGEKTIVTPGLDAEGTRLLRLYGARLLQLSFGFATQFTYGFLRSDVMNTLNGHIESLEQS